MKLFLIAVATAFSFSAHAGLEAYAGNYSGKFEGTRGTLSISANGSTLSASFTADNGSHDLFGGQCGSTIGSMTKLDMDDNEVDYAVFAFDSGSCVDVEGRELTVDFSHKHGAVTGASASVFERMETTWQNECHPDPSGGMHCWPVQQSVPYFATGKFKK